MGDSDSGGDDSGRDLVAVTSKVNPETRDWLEERAEEQGETRSRVIKGILESEQSDDRLTSDDLLMLGMGAAVLYFGVQAAMPVPGVFVIGGGLLVAAVLIGAAVYRFRFE
jgi:hypothetical protein